MSKPTIVTWCSFADEDRGFLGAVIVPGEWDAVALTDRLRQLGKNPGGQVLVTVFDISELSDEERNRVATHSWQLLSEEDSRTLFRGMSINELRST